MLEQLWEIREEVQRRKPLVFHITNTVAAGFTANILLAAGVSPLMSAAAAEAEELAKCCDVLVLNIGTLHTQQISHMLKAGECANACGKPVVFDPVGVGATAYRNMTATQLLLDISVALVRGNIGELNSLTGLTAQVKGVDSQDGQLNLEGVKAMARTSGALFAATGPVDYLTDGTALFQNGTGHALLQAVTGSGCALSSLAGAFLAVAGDRRLGVLAALAYYGAAAEKAAGKSKGPGSFATKFLDALYSLRFKEFRKLVADRAFEVLAPVAAEPDAAVSSPCEGNG